MPVSIDFQKNNFTLYDPSPEIPYLKWAKVRPNIWRIIWHELVNLFFGNVYSIVIRNVLQIRENFE
jgi:hypothetical protein